MACVSLKHAILGFLDLEPATGYLLQQRFEGSVGSFWSATQSQIYRELHGLEKLGQACVEVVAQDGKPARKVYSLTDAGRTELARWLGEPVEPPQLRDPLLLKLVFAAELPAAQLDHVLSQYAESLRATRREYQARLGAKEIFSLARSKREALLWELSLDNGLAWCEAQLAWTERASQRLLRTPGDASKTRARERAPRKGERS
jgi:PadR family transcriptional regulator, regulatory protein AphA